MHQTTLSHEDEPVENKLHGEVSTFLENREFIYFFSSNDCGVCVRLYGSCFEDLGQHTYKKYVYLAANSVDVIL